MSVNAFHRELRRDRWRLFALIAIPAFLLALILDWPAYQILSIDTLIEGEDSPQWKIEQRQLYQFVRLVGYIPAWLAIALAVDLAGRRRRSPMVGVERDDRGLVTPGILACTLLTGLVVAFMKALIGRERPLKHDGEWYFKPFLDGFTDGSNLSTPSSHAAIAVAGALVISRLRPGTGFVAIPLAVACAYSRVLMGAHFISDVVLGAIVAWVVVELVVPKGRVVGGRA